jgi:hypothetical protein
MRPAGGLAYRYGKQADALAQATAARAAMQFSSTS